MMQSRINRSVRFLCYFGCLYVAWQPLSAVSAEPGDSLPRGAKIVVRLNLAAWRETETGSQLMGQIQRKMLEEISHDLAGDVESQLEKIQRVLGFDPWKEIQSLTLTASDFDRPERSFSAVVQMKTTTGNLEGLMLALPGYSFSQEGRWRIHSVGKSEDDRLFATIEDSPAGKRLHLAARRDLLREFLPKNSPTVEDSSSDSRSLADPQAESLLEVRLRGLDPKQFEEEPVANLARVLNSLSFVVSEENNDLKVELEMSARTREQTEQLRQMAQGLIALLDLAATLDPEDEDLKKVRDMTREFDVRQEGDAVHVRFYVASEPLVEWLRTEIEDE